MALNLDLTLSENEFGKYDASIRCIGTDEKGITFISIMQDDPLKTATEALKMVLRYSPHLDQEEFTKNWKEAPCVPFPD